METQIVMVNGKSRRVIERKGILYVREAVEVRLDHYIHATKKALEIGGANYSDLIRKLLEGFCNSMSFGREDKQIKDAGSLFDRRLSRHIETAVIRALEEVAQCQVDASRN